MAGIDHKQRMLAGLPYQANGGSLPAERDACARLLHEYNTLPPERWDERDVLIRKILGQVGEGIEVRPPFYCDYGANIQVGDGFYANFNLTVLDVARVTFGDNCFIGPNVQVLAAGHPMHAEPRRAGWEWGLPVTVDDDVWIGGGAIILPGVHIGRGAVIGAGSVVTRDVPECVLAAGNPCRVIRPIGDDERLLYRKGCAFPD